MIPHAGSFSRSVDGVVNGFQWDAVNLRFMIRLNGKLTDEPRASGYIQERIDRIQVQVTKYFIRNNLPHEHLNDDDAQMEDADSVEWINDPEFYLVDGSRVSQLSVSRLANNSYVAHINVTNFKNRKQIPNGTWKIIPVYEGRVCAPLRFDLADAPALADHSRVFLYNGNFSAYTVSFGLSEDDFRPELLLRTFAFGRGRKARRKPNPLARFKKSLFGRERRISILNRWYRFCRKYRKVDGQNILFASEARSSLSGNLASIHSRLVSRGLDDKFNIDSNFLMQSERSISKRLAQVKKIAQADFLIIDDYFPTLGFLKIDNGTKIIQAWHAGSGFKAVGYSRFGNYGSPKLTNSHRKYTYAIAGSSSLVPVYAENFGIEESAVIPTGLPRIDTFLDPDSTSKSLENLYNEFPILQGKKVLLFAPTFRGRGMQTAYYDYDRVDFDALYTALPADTVVAFRMHHFVDLPVPIKAEHTDRFVDLTRYPDGLGLLHAVDLLITDYSSIIYEYSLLDRPMIFYAYDRDIYSATRGFHRPYDETAPGRVCLTFDDLINSIVNEDYEIDKVAKFRSENFDHVDTKSSDRFIDWLLLEQPKE